MVTVLAITGILALLFVVVLRSKLKRFAMTLELWKIRFNVEVESETTVDTPAPATEVVKALPDVHTGTPAPMEALPAYDPDAS